jgi:hypothetical protein
LVAKELHPDFCTGYGATAGMAGERHEQMAGRTGRRAGVTQL